MTGPGRAPRINAMVSKAVLAAGLVCLVFCPHPEALHLFAAEQPESLAPKDARSEFDMGQFHRFISSDLSRTQSRGSLRDMGLETRIVQGRVIDHEGNPVSRAAVAIVEDIGYSNQSYDENYDRTDDLGRFLVEGDLTKTRLVVKRAAGDCWKVHLKTGQKNALVTWPKPARCRLTVDAELCDPGATVTLGTTRYWAGMSILRISARLVNGQADIPVFIPGEYSVTVNRSIPIGEEERTRPVEVGHFSIEAGETKDVHLRPQGKRILSGQVSTVIRPLTLQIERQKVEYVDWLRIVEFVSCDDEGRFKTRALEPGRYLLRFSGPRPKVNRQFRGFINVNQPFTIKQRIVVPEADQPVEIKAGVRSSAATSFVESTLDQEVTGRWSNVDVQVKRLASHVERETVARQLMQLAADRQSPYRWRDPILKSLGAMTDTPGVTEFLLAQLNELEPAESRRRGPIIRAFDESKHDVPKIIDGIAPFRQNDHFRVRWATYYTLGRLVQWHPESRDHVIALLTPMLNDPWERIRGDIASTLGYLKAESALSALRKTRDDPVGQVRVRAAKAIWQITGDADQAIRLMTARLNSAKQSGRLEAAYMLAEFEKLPPITIKALVAAAEFNGPARSRDGATQLRNQIKRSAIATLKKHAPDQVPAERKTTRP